MATIKFSSISYGQSITFNPATDTLTFDDPSISAGLGTVTEVTTDLKFSYAKKDFTLQGVSLGQLTSKNVVFSSGSKLLVGDDTVNTINDDLANSLLTGGAQADLLYGMGGNDTLNGGANADVMIGGAGVDTYMVDDAGDQANENDDGLGDTVNASVSYTLNANVENLTLIGNANIDATGNSLNNLLIGNTGSNRLDGGKSGDTMIGGDGSDAYLVDNNLDLVEEASSKTIGGTDTVLSFISYVLTDNVENLTLQDEFSYIFNINATGNALNNTLIGNNDQNVLDGRLGADTMEGGDSNDIYYIDDVADLVIEGNSATTSNQIDLVKSTISYTLTQNVENLQLMGGANINGTGNILDNIFYANTGDNIFDGISGIDTVSYESRIDSKAVYAGTDASYAGVSISLALAGAQSTRGSGKDTFINIDNLIGSQYNDTLTGNDAANVLDGSGGADRLDGGKGDETYIVDGADLVIESANAGIDTVQSSVSYVLGDNVEQLILIGTAAINGTGNELVNTITGNNGANFLDGMGGADRLEGGNGNDSYIVDSFDTVIEQSGGGMDLVLADISYTLPSNVENLQLLGSDDLTGTGNALANVIFANTGDNLLDGVKGSGVDTVSYQFGATSGVTVDLSATTAQVTGGSGTDTLKNFGNLTGSIYDDLLIGTSTDNVLNGLDGMDTVSYQSATAGVTVDLSSKSAQPTGSSGKDTLLNIENLIGSTFEDTITASESNNIIKGGNGVDTVSYATAKVAVDVSLATEDIQNTGGSGKDTLIGIENLIGSKYNDTLTGNSGENLLNGGAGVDRLIGGDGNDIYIIDNMLDIVTEKSTQSSQIDTVQSNVSFILSDNVENLQLLDTKAVSINGTGNVLNNHLMGNAASNILIGDAGNDTLDGGAGKDVLQGDLGADYFSFALISDTKLSDPDVISDFIRTQGDKVDLSLPTFYEGTFKFISNIAFSDVAGELRFDTNAGNTLITGDINGDSIADFAIQLTGVTTPMVATDFVL